MFRCKAFKQAGSRRGLEHAHHGRYNAALLNEIDLALKNRRRITVEAHAEAAHHLQSGAVNFFDILEQIPVFIVRLAAFGEAVRIRRLYADKNGIESGLGHHFHEFGVIGEVDRCFGKKDASFFILTPFDQGRKQMLLKGTFVADKIVVHKKDIAAPTRLVNCVQFSNYLLRRFGARRASEKRRNVAELAIEWASSGVLNIQRCIATGINQAPQRDRAAAYFRRMFI